jgi:GGDEF domain-containing protein
MVNGYVVRNGLERRAYRTSNITLNDLPVGDTYASTTVKYGDPLRKCANRAEFVELLEGQIDLSLIGRYPLCLAVVEFEIESSFVEDAEPILHAAARHFSCNLRPTDIIVRYQTNSLALILHEADEVGGKIVGERLSRKLQRFFKIGHYGVRFTPIFGFSSTIASHQGGRAEKLLASAETALKNAEQKREQIVANCHEFAENGSYSG